MFGAALFMGKVPSCIFILQYHHSVKQKNQTQTYNLKGAVQSNTSKNQASLIISDLKYGLQGLRLEKIRDYACQILRRYPPMVLCFVKQKALFLHG